VCVGVSARALLIDASVTYVKKKKGGFDDLRMVLHQTNGVYPVHQPQVLNDAKQTIV
jgi:hypothetical protein